MHTRRLVAGEAFSLEEEKGFCLVVEGCVQIFVKSQQDEQSNSADSDDEESSTQQRQGYQLLTEIRTGAPMSSLFSILSLFTEDVPARDATKPNGDAPSTPTHQPRHSFSRMTHNSIAGPRLSARTHSYRKAKSQPSSQPTSPDIPGGHLKTVPPLELDSQEEPPQTPPEQEKIGSTPNLRREPSAHPDIVARAAEDSTIAIIPATAFRRLTKMHPKATSHVVQVILTRFYRVTLSTAHRYLGLTQEILNTEKKMNKLVSSDMPSFLLGQTLERLKEKFAVERERLGSEDLSKGIALHNPRMMSHRRASLKTEVLASTRTSKANGRRESRQPSPEDERRGVNAGDLLKARGTSNAMQTPLQKVTSPMEKGYFQPRTMKLQRQDSMDEGLLYREVIFDCMCLAMGLTHKTTAPRFADSVEQSPRLVSYDSKKQKAVFDTVFGLMTPYDIDGDSESNVSTSASHNPLTNSPNINDMVDDVEIVYFPANSVLVDQQERLPGLYYVIDGFLEVGITMEDDGDDSVILGTSTNRNRDSLSGQFLEPEITPNSSSSRQSLHLVRPGSLAGYFPAVSGFRSFVDVRAKSDVIVGFLPRASLERLVDKYPMLLLTLAKRLTSVLGRVILHIDFALEYLQINSGHVIYEQKQRSDAIYIILNGRLRGIHQTDNKPLSVLGEYGQGDSVGELEVLTGTTRPGSLHAIRDSELAKLPLTLFNCLAQEHPAITMKMSKFLARRMRSLVDNTTTGTQERMAIGGAKNPAATVNLRTIGILPVRDGVPVLEFASRLVSALTHIGTSVVSLNQTAILKHLGRHAFSKMGKLKLSQYLADLEEKFGLVLYIVDTSVQSPWTATCITQSDCILIVGVADDSPDVGEYERFLVTAKSTARKELVLLHPERFCPAGLTQRWLRNRLWVNGGHHHIQMPLSSLGNSQQRHVYHPLTSRKLAQNIRQGVQVITTEFQRFTGRKVRQKPAYSTVAPHKGDFHRLARRLCGKSIGLVLGGGGARGCAHVGVLRAMEEAGIPIDIVGGTSIGAFVGALYAWDASILPMFGRLKRFSGRMGSMWRFALDLTYPSASYTSGLEFNRGIWKTFGNYLIEDFWLPFYCNTTNISKSCAEYHDRGYVWRYIRASMSLAGLLPPLCEEGSMLLDGGYIDNLTVAHMRSLGADLIFAIDVGSLDDQTPQMYGDSLSGFWSLWNRWNPFSGIPNPPSLGDIQSRLAYVSSVEALERAKNMNGCIYMRPPIDGFGTLAFGEFETIEKIGYAYGKEKMEELKRNKLLPGNIGWNNNDEGENENAEGEAGDALLRTRMERRASI
jgi:lysophospholipid hydrolase